MTQAKNQIVDGPSTEALFMALRLRNEGRTVEITLEYPGSDDGVFGGIETRVAVQVDSIAVEDGSGERWFIEFTTPVTNQKYRAHYNARTRRGRIIT